MKNSITTLELGDTPITSKLQVEDEEDPRKNPDSKCQKTQTKDCNTTNIIMESPDSNKRKELCPLRGHNTAD
eukprot:15333063-Ditylum_brightwellii.AAC.1